MSAGAGPLRVVLSTVENDAQAAAFAEQLVTGGLAACVTTIPGARSVYRWKGELCRDSEQVLLIKTAWADEVEREALFARLAELHPYDEPELVALAPDAVSAGYATWALEQMGRGGDAEEPRS